MLKVGDFVLWKSCHLNSAFARNQVIAIEGDKCQLRFIEHFLPMDQMERITPTERERLFCESYHLPVRED